MGLHETVSPWLPPALKEGPANCQEGTDGSQGTPRPSKELRYLRSRVSLQLQEACEPLQETLQPTRGNLCYASHFAGSRRELFPLSPSISRHLVHGPFTFISFLFVAWSFVHPWHSKAFSFVILEDTGVLSRRLWPPPPATTHSVSLLVFLGPKG